MTVQELEAQLFSKLMRLDKKRERVARQKGPGWNETTRIQVGARMEGQRDMLAYVLKQLRKVDRKD